MGGREGGGSNPPPLSPPLHKKNFKPPKKEKKQKEKEKTKGGTPGEGGGGVWVWVREGRVVTPSSRPPNLKQVWGSGCGGREGREGGGGGSYFPLPLLSQTPNLFVFCGGGEEGLPPPSSPKQATSLEFGFAPPPSPSLPRGPTLCFFFFFLFFLLFLGRSEVFFFGRRGEERGYGNVRGQEDLREEPVERRRCCGASERRVAFHHTKRNSLCFAKQQRQNMHCQA